MSFHSAYQEIFTKVNKITGRGEGRERGETQPKTQKIGGPIQEVQQVNIGSYRIMEQREIEGTL